jgi:hypothetical protein
VELGDGDVPPVVVNLPASRASRSRTSSVRLPSAVGYVSVVAFWATMGRLPAHGGPFPATTMDSDHEEDG